jgi:hypothetical protein
MSIKAKELLKDKFWVVEDDARPIGMISVNEQKRYVLSDSSGTKYFNSTNQIKKFFGNDFYVASIKDLEVLEPSNDVYGYPTSTIPYNTLYDVQKKLPLFTKSPKSKSLYCAGYYIIKFDKGWVKSFCPKAITVERYETRGPFKSSLEMRKELSIANKEKA